MPESLISPASTALLPHQRTASIACGEHPVKALNQTLQQKLRGTSLRLTSVHPGGVKTDIARSSGSYGSESRYVGSGKIPVS